MLFIKPCEGRITSPFGMRVHPVSKRPTTMHWGVDFGNSLPNNKIVAAASGRVTYAKWTNGYGNTVMIVHAIGGRTYETVYAHLASIGVTVGQSVNQGQSIGVKGTTGISTGIHLHFEIHIGRWNNRFTNAVDPIPYTIDEEVKMLQQLLNEAGFKLIVDGKRGKATNNAILTFQRRSGLVVDGIVGPATLYKLKRQAY